MATRDQIDRFLARRKLAVVGASQTGKKFGNTVLKELATKDYEIFPVHRQVDQLGGLACYRSLADLPAEVKAAVLVTPQAETEVLVRDAADAGFEQLWLQQGAETPEAVAFCAERRLDCIHDECILMFAEPAHWFHRLHRGLWGLLGKLPE